MQLQYVANACFLIRFQSGRLMLTDPWFRGPCQQTWWNYPPVPDALAEEVAAARPDWIYISHLHHDHLHEESLASYPRDAPILIGRMRSPGLSNALRRMGFETIVEQPFETVFPLEPNGCQAVLFSDFHATTIGGESLLSYDLDTSIYLLDTDGARVFNAVDNTIQPDDARRIRTLYGAPDAAMIPYASASIFPMGMSDYDDDAKRAAGLAVRARSAERFAQVARALGTRQAIAAGGEYVLGGPVAAQSRFLPQPLEAELRQALDVRGDAGPVLVKLHPGDSLDTAANTVSRDGRSVHRGFTDAQRADYALSLRDRTPSYAQVAVEDLKPDWARLLSQCARNLLQRCAKAGYAPPLDLWFDVRAYGDSQPLFRFRLACDTGEHGFADAQAGPQRRTVTYRLDERLLFCLTTGLLSWNAMEASALIGLSRQPDLYDADLHRLIVYFSLLA